MISVIIYDIRFTAVVPDTDESVQLIINVEAQKSDKTPYPIIKRAIYYASRMISAQKNRVFVNKHYEKIRKVYSIWLELEVDEKKSNTISRYHIAEDQVIGNISEGEKNYDLLTIMILRLGDPNKAKDKSILRLLDALLSHDIRAEEKRDVLDEYDIPMTEELKEEVNIMCNLGEGLVERTEQRTRLDSVLNLMNSLKLSAEEAINAIGVPAEDRKSLLEMLDKRMTAK